MTSLKKTFKTMGDQVEDEPQSLTRTVVGCWPLLFGIGLIMVGNGLQGSLLGLRATFEGFSHAVTGLIMSGYFVGYSLGSIFTSHMLDRVGHIRVFAALSSLVSIAALLHALFLTPALWLMMRICTGFCLAGLFVVAESWLNESITNLNRGKLLAFYMVVTLGGLGIGPLLLNFAEPSGFELFILVSVLFSFALVPILLTVGPAPNFEVSKQIKIRELYSDAPLGVAGCVVAGLSNGTILALGAVYAEAIGLSIKQVSLLMSVTILGGVLFQLPIGVVSDKFDRRIIFTIVTFAAAASAATAILFSTCSLIGLYFFVGIFGGLSFPMYSLCLAITNDRLDREQMVDASSVLVLFTGLGAIVGPLVTGVAMSLIGSWTFLGFLAFVHAVLGLYIIYRIILYPPVPVEEQGEYAYLPRTSSVSAVAAYGSEVEK
jgi:MFS family permease